MKKEYVSPLIICEKFQADEYVAACGDSGTIYKFKCDAGNKISGSVYVESNGVEGLQTGRGGDTNLTNGRPYTSYSSCNLTHEANSKDEFEKGYFIPFRSDQVVDVIVWRGPKHDNIHCTTNLDMSTWETAKS